jgi:hypothetical protein
MATGIDESSMKCAIESPTSFFSLSKPMMKPRSDEHAGPVNFVNVVDQIPAGILLLPHRRQGFRVGTFDIDEQREEICISHHAQKFVIVGEIH